ncbi:hypothetical protein SH661x_003574 [Planctomicrobium sp. SH661]|uniref:hypothetical protein n=1 Tax=Planctomicrobium sp. SH661 TaxID=3448124 RepID=UPI003F5C855E
MSSPEIPSTPGEAIDDGHGRIFPCPRCGADLVFHIGEQGMKCTFCGSTQTINLDPTSSVQEQDFHATLEKLKSQKSSEEPQAERNEVRCESCGADVLFEGTLTSTKCPYCGSPIQREKIHRGGFRIPVEGVLAFRVTEDRANMIFSRWVRTRWFAPNDFKHAGRDKNLNGVYLPCWTFDALTFTQYDGKRGDHDTVTSGVGKDRKSETHTRWTPVSGKFQKFFDDVLIHAATGLPKKHLHLLSPWPLEKLVPFSPEYLAGFFARTYDIDLDSGFEQARVQMEDRLRVICHQKIGGDEQKLLRMDCRYDAITFKHLLLPVWMLAFRHRDRSYRVFVNAVTGMVTGERPYSWPKVIAATLAGIAVAIGTVLLFQR